MKTLSDTTTYTVKATGQVVSVPYSYASYDNLDEAIDTLGEAKALAQLNQVSKEDVGNNERTKAKFRNGHSDRPVVSPEQKLAVKEKSQLLGMAIKAGLTTDEIKQRLGIA